MKNYVNSLAKIDVIMVHWGKKWCRINFETNFTQKMLVKITNNDKEMNMKF